MYRRVLDMSDDMHRRVLDTSDEQCRMNSVTGSGNLDQDLYLGRTICRPGLADEQYLRVNSVG